MSHGGLLGTSEAAFCGVPMVVTPMYGDQFLNAAAIERRGMAKIVQYEDITVDTLNAAIKGALEPETMRKAKQVSYEYRNRPKGAIESAVWWTEHVAATKGFPLGDTYAKNLPMYVYYSLDVYATFAVVLILVGVLIRFLVGKCFGKKSTIKTKVQ